MEYNIVKWRKDGANFADGNSANQDRMSILSSEFIESFNNAIEILKEKSIFFETTYHWEQSECTLYIVRKISDKFEYENELVNQGINKRDNRDAFVNSGWVYLEDILQEEVPNFDA